MRPACLAAAVVMLSAQGWCFTRGTAGAEFLKIANGVRAVGMGSSYAAIGEDVYSVYWNPAGIGVLTAPEFAGSYVRLYENAGAASMVTMVVEHPGVPFGIGNGAAGIVYLTSGEFDSTDPDAYVRAAPGSSSDMMMFVSSAFPVLEGVTGGFTVKGVRRALTGPDPDTAPQWDPVSQDYIQTKSVIYQSFGAATDAGVLWQTWDRTFSAGFSIQNIGLMGGFNRNLSFDLSSGAEVMPVTYRAGGAVRTRLWGQSLLVSGDLHAFADSIDAPGMSVGAEYGLSGIAFFRLGWEQQVDQPFGRGAVDVGKRSGVSTLPSPFRTGMGLRWKLTSDSMVQFDYALAPFGTLGTVNHVAMLFRWNIPKPKTIVPPTIQERPKAAMVIEPKKLAWKEKVKEWKVEVRDDRGKVVKTFAGTGIPPKSLDWDGTDERGRVVTGVSKFKFVMKAKDVRNKMVESVQTVGSIGAQAQLKPIAGKPLYPEVVFTLPQADYKQWSLVVRDADRVVRQWKDTGSPPREIRWSGRNDATGKALVLVAPKYAWEFIEEGGEKSRGERALPRVEAEMRPTLLSNRVRLVGIRFRGAESEITENHAAVLERASQFISEHPGSSLMLESYADIPGGDEDNFMLAKRRAEKVLRAMVEDYGVKAGRISVRSYGRSRSAPRYPNIPEEEQRQRVDLVINVQP